MSCVLVQHSIPCSVLLLDGSIEVQPLKVEEGCWENAFSTLFFNRQCVDGNLIKMQILILWVSIGTCESAFLIRFY